MPYYIEHLFDVKLVASSMASRGKDMFLPYKHLADKMMDSANIILAALVAALLSKR
jgi:hypothetical protein